MLARIFRMNDFPNSEMLSETDRVRLLRGNRETGRFSAYFRALGGRVRNCAVGLAALLLLGAVGCHSMTRGPEVKDLSARDLTPYREVAMTEPQAPEHSPLFQKALDAREAGNQEACREALTALLTGTADVDQKERRDARAMLKDVNKELVFGRKGGERYTVRWGDTLGGIAGKYRVTADMLRQVNGIKGDLIRAGQSLKVLRGPIAGEVVKSTHSLNVWLGKTLLAQYPVGLGRSGAGTPTGTFTVRTKVEKPTWFKNGRAYPYGHADNPLGERWLGFKNTAQHKGYGIHGTSDESSVGTDVSQGCIRLANEDVMEVFKLMPRGAQVKIRD